MKMSDVFKLPVSPSLMGDDHVEQLVECGYEHYCLEDSAYWMASNLEHIQHAAHAINHADALADALDNVIETLELYGAHDSPYCRIAIDELKKYRGCSDE